MTAPLRRVLDAGFDPPGRHYEEPHHSREMFAMTVQEGRTRLRRSAADHSITIQDLDGGGHGSVRLQCEGWEDYCKWLSGFYLVGLVEDLRWARRVPPAPACLPPLRGRCGDQGAARARATCPVRRVHHRCVFGPGYRPGSRRMPALGGWSCARAHARVACGGWRRGGVGSFACAFRTRDHELLRSDMRKRTSLGARPGQFLARAQTAVKAAGKLPAGAEVRAMRRLTGSAAPHEQTSARATCMHSS